jgi:hypothetical protein
VAVVAVAAVDQLMSRSGSVTIEFAVCVENGVGTSRLV